MLTESIAIRSVRLMVLLGVLLSVPAVAWRATTGRALGRHADSVNDLWHARATLNERVRGEQQQIASNLSLTRELAVWESLRIRYAPLIRAIEKASTPSLEILTLYSDSSLDYHSTPPNVPYIHGLVRNYRLRFGGLASGARPDQDLNEYIQTLYPDPAIRDTFGHIELSALQKDSKAYREGRIDKQFGVRARDLKRGIE